MLTLIGLSIPFEDTARLGESETASTILALLSTYSIDFYTNFHLPIAKTFKIVYYHKIQDFLYKLELSDVYKD